MLTTQTPAASPGLVRPRHARNVVGPGHPRRRPSASAPLAPRAAAAESDLSVVQSVHDNAALASQFQGIDELVRVNMQRVQQALCNGDVTDQSQASATGSVQDWAALDNALASIMGTPSALIRLSLLSGTHAIATAFRAALRPNDELLAISGEPYDTLEEVIGTRSSGEGSAGAASSLADWGVSFRVHPLGPDGLIDLAGLRHAVVPGKTRVCHIQRSCGYALRPTLTIAEIRDAVATVRALDAAIVVTVDNCYGEFTEALEPGHAGADLVMGSLIKNPGGTIATGGGYVAGRADLVESAQRSLAGGATRGGGGGGEPVTADKAQMLAQGLWMAPAKVGEALKGGRVIAHAAAEAGFVAAPRDSALERPSFITAVQLGSAAAMQAFCGAVQLNSPVGSYIRPEPGVTPGYGDEVLFADGTFIDGSTAELSADGPLRPPHVVYCQGGTHWTHWAIVLDTALAAARKVTP